LIEALQNPETADLSVLNRDQKNSQPWWKTTFFKGIGIAVIILAAVVALAFALQALP
jgi:hypothetical protein